jgi:AcrR family transcriptional regulator
MPPTTVPLTAERILEVTEEVLRRHGPAKATVVDVARALGVSHGSVYRHFRTKTALREAVTRRWLDLTTEVLAGIVADTGQEPEARLRTWFTTFFEAKRRKAGLDPELFATYMALAAESGELVGAHVDELTGQLAQLVRAGVARGTFTSADPDVTARALFQATACFHDPAHAPTWQEPGVDEDLAAVLDLLLGGLRSGGAVPSP